MMFSSYIDRQKSGLGTSEKSQKVHSANWKEEVQLRKELDCLNKQEQQRVSRICIDQRLAVNRFHKKLSKSVIIATSHEQATANLDEHRHTSVHNEHNTRQHMRTIRCLNAFPKPPVPTVTRRSKSCEPPKTPENDSTPDNQVAKTTEKDLMPRPMTALEKRNRVWERQLNTVTQRINRARSAPPAKTAFYKVPEFSRCQETSKRVGKQSRAPARQRGVTYTMDLDVYRYVRGKEIVQQREAVKAFLKSIEPLELVPWTRYDSDHNEIDRTENESTEHRGSSSLHDTANRLPYDASKMPTKAWT